MKFFMRASLVWIHGWRDFFRVYHWYTLNIVQNPEELEKFWACIAVYKLILKPEKSLQNKESTYTAELISKPLLWSSQLVEQF